MPERNHKVIIDGHLFPDSVTVTLANEECINSRDYVFKDLYESVCAANDAWRDENDRLRELVRVFHFCTTSGDCRRCRVFGGKVDLAEDTVCHEVHDQMRELGIEVIE